MVNYMVYASISWLILNVINVHGHFTIWTPSMYGFNQESQNPLGPGIMNISEWWFRGPNTTLNDPPAPGNITTLIAGTDITLEANCNKQFTSFGQSPQPCPYPGPYHNNIENKFPIDPLKSGGCALAIADVDDIRDTNWDNLVVFSVQRNCITNGSNITFSIPQQMPKCSGSKCICGWFWQPQYGAGNFFMTAFDCAVTQVVPGNRSYGIPQTPALCNVATNDGCVRGAKSPIFIWNNPENINYPQANNRPGYRPEWSFNDGPQDDIFVNNDNNAILRKGSARIAAPKSLNTMIIYPYNQQQPSRRQVMIA